MMRAEPAVVPAVNWAVGPLDVRVPGGLAVALAQVQVKPAGHGEGLQEAVAVRLASPPGRSEAVGGLTDTLRTWGISTAENLSEALADRPSWLVTMSVIEYEPATLAVSTYELVPVTLTGGWAPVGVVIVRVAADR